MMRFLPACLTAVLAAGNACAAERAANDSARWQTETRAVRIVRDQWGIAHIYGKSDSEAVFGATCCSRHRTYWPMPSGAIIPGSDDH